MKQSFESLEVRQKSFEMVKEVGKIFYHKEFRNYSFQDQIMRATLSISNNIAEGNDRGSAKDYIRFLYISKGSAAEVKSMLYVAESFGYISNEQKEIYIEKVSSIINQLGKFIPIPQIKNRITPHSIYPIRPILMIIDIKKLAKLTGLKLTPAQEEKFTTQLSEVVDMLDQIKNYTIEKPSYTRQSLLGLQSYPSKTGVSDSNPDAILKNVAHPITGHSVEVKAFVE